MSEYADYLTEEAAKQGAERLFEHLTAKLDDLGHFLDPDGRLAMFTDYQHVHEVEHEPGTWYTDALMHTHDDAGRPVPKAAP